MADLVTENQWKRVGELIRERRSVLYNTRQEFAHHARVHVSLVKMFEDGGRSSKGRWELPPAGSKKLFDMLAMAGVVDEDNDNNELLQLLAGLLHRSVPDLVASIDHAFWRLSQDSRDTTASEEAFDRFRDQALEAARFEGEVFAQLNELGYGLIRNVTDGPDFIGSVNGVTLLVDVKGGTEPDLVHAVGQMLAHRHDARADGAERVVGAVVVRDEPDVRSISLFMEADLVLTWPPDYTLLDRALPAPRVARPAALRGSLDELTLEELEALRRRINEKLGDA